MTDKQIIIDGCDVSGCDRLNTFPMQFGEPHEICLTSLEQWGGQEKYCKDRPNCYYKQLKRKEQECERLKHDNGYEVGALEKTIDNLKFDYAELEKRHNDSFEQFKQLKAENDELKRQHQGDKGLITSTGKMNYQLIQEVDKLKAENDELKKWKENIIYLFNRTCRCKHLNEETEICGLNNKKCISINECMYRKQQTLTEIKEIVKAQLPTVNYNFAKSMHPEMFNCYEQILQKISEVSNDMEND